MSSVVLWRWMLCLVLCASSVWSVRAQDAADCGDDLEEAGSGAFYFFLFGSVILIIISGVFSGLTVGYMSLSPMNLEITARSGPPKEKKMAQRVLPVLKNHNLLLVTLVLANSAAAQTLPIFFDRIVPTYLAILLSVTAILFMGEIIPQAVCTGPARLPITSTFAYPVRFLIILFWIVGYPISKLMDRVLGDDRVTMYRRNELKELIAMHQVDAVETGQIAEPEDDAPPHKPPTGGLNPEEVSIITGTLDLRGKLTADIMVPWSEVKMLSYDDVLDIDTMAKIVAHGHSRLPVYRGSKFNVQGYLLVKKLIVAAPEEERPINSFSNFRKPLVARPDTNLFQLLRKFLKNSVRMCIVTPQAEALRALFKGASGNLVDIPDDIELLGLVTIEDVMEELMQEDIRDEHDHSLLHRMPTVEANVVQVTTGVVGVQRAIRRFHSLARHARARIAARKRLQEQGGAGSGTGAGGDDPKTTDGDVRAVSSPSGRRGFQVSPHPDHDAEEKPAPERK